MQYLNSITGVKGQPIPASMNLHPGQWVKVSNGKNYGKKGMYIGTVNSTKEQVFVWRKGQSVQEQNHQVRVARAFVTESNRPGRTMNNLWEYLAKIFS